MATLASDRMHPIVRDRLFFFVMSLVVAAVTVSGFVLQFAMGRSSLGAPWWVHLHGVTMIGWLALYVTQNWLVWRGDVAAHMKLGRIAAVYACWVVLVGLVTTPMTIAAHRTPPAFEPPFFLMMDWLNVIFFAGIVWAGVALRGASDWHRRLMLASAFFVMLPGVGRISLILDTGPLGMFGMILVLWLVAAVYDWMTRGRPHLAYAWAFGAFVVMVVITGPLAMSSPVIALTKYLQG